MDGKATLLDSRVIRADEQPLAADRLVRHLHKPGIHFKKQYHQIFFREAVLLINFDSKSTLMKTISFFVLSLLLMSCGTSHYCYVVRHADKLDKTPYSVLSPAGHARAGVLKDKLLNKKIDFVFATPFQRTQETAQPLARAMNKTILIYRNNAEDSMANVIKALSNKNVLLVGHSGNIPSIIEKATGKKIKPIPEEEYDNLYIIKFKGKKILLTEAKY